MAIRVILCFLLCVVCVRVAQCLRLNPKFLLMTHLMKKYPKDGIYVPPSENMIVNVTLIIYTVYGLDENEVMEIDGWAKVQWNDPRLMWDTGHWHSVLSVYINRDKIWIPDVGIMNSKQRENKDFSQTKDRQAEIRPTGDVSFYAYFLSKSPCPVNTRAFPFDEQACPLDIGTSHSKSSDFTIRIANVSQPSIGKSTVSQWTPDRAFVLQKQIPAGKSADDTFQVVRISLVLKRKPTYHIVLVIVPYAFICIVGSLLFVVGPPGERLALSLTVLLAMSVYMMITAQAAPKSMIYLSAMDKFLLGQMALQVMVTFIVVLGPMLFKQKTSGLVHLEKPAIWQKLPRWGRRCDGGWLLIYLLTTAINAMVCLVALPKSMTDVLRTVNQNETVST